MTNASGNGQSWALTYDEDNRTTSIQWDCGMLAKFITNRYDALGRRISRRVTDDGVETRYVLDLAGSMERILCDTDAGGNITAWYVHGPDLAYKVDTTNGFICYHADAQANIIATSGTNGAVLSQYAYTPYGRSFGSSAISNLQSQISNPYLFVGSQGVMEELPGLYFMRARYYSADAGVFLSTDPVKKIGPGWKPIAYTYGGASPTRYVDPDGEAIVPVILFVAFVILTADTALEAGDLAASTYDNKMKMRLGQISKKQAIGEYVLDSVDVIPVFGKVGKVVEGLKIGGEFARAADTGDWLSVVPIVGPIRSINQHASSMAENARNFRKQDSGASESAPRRATSASPSFQPASNVGHANQTTSMSGPRGNLSSGGGGSGSSISLSGNTASAGIFGNLMTLANGTKGAQSTGGSGIAVTTPALGGTALANNSSTKSGSTPTTISTAPKSGTSSNNPFVAAWNWFTGLFR